MVEWKSPLVGKKLKSTNPKNMHQRIGSCGVASFTKVVTLGGGGGGPGTKPEKDPASLLAQIHICICVCMYKYIDIAIHLPRVYTCILIYIYIYISIYTIYTCIMLYYTGKRPIDISLPLSLSMCTCV